MSNPSLVVSLASDGSLVAEHFWNGGRRQTALHDGSAEADIRRILQGMLLRPVAIGEDGAPTQHQLRHWERHTAPEGGIAFGDPQCPFCIAEGRFAAPIQRRAQRGTLTTVNGTGPDKVEVRTLPPGSAKKLAAQRLRRMQKEAATMSAEELGL